MSKAILDALGVTDEVSALRAIAEFTTFLNGVKDAVGAEKLGESVVRVQQNAAFVRSILDAVGKPTPEVLGTVLAWKVAAEELPKTQARCSEVEASLDARERADLIKQGLDERKLTPGSVSYWNELDEHGRAKRSSEDLKAFLASAAKVIPAALKQPKSEGGTGPIGGKDYGDMTPGEKHALKVQVGQEAFDSIRDDYYTRTGKKKPGA